MPGETLKRVLLFAWNTPSGGWNDFILSFDTVKQANVYWMANHSDKPNKQFIDRDTGLPTAV